MAPLLSASIDIIRLIAVPVLFWAAYKDIKTRRVSNRPWLFLTILGVALIIADGLLIELGLPTHKYPPTFWRSVALSVLTVIPLAYLAWLLGLFGGADAKALMTFAILFPMTPTYSLSFATVGNGIIQLPQYTFPVSIFAFTIFANAILLSMLYPVVMAIRNTISGNLSKVMFLAKPLSIPELEHAHGIVFQTPSGFGRGVDLDVVRSYLDWRGTSLSALTPVSTTDCSAEGTEPSAISAIERWDVDTFFDETTDPTYGMTKDTVADGLDVIFSKRTVSEDVWISPGIPYMVPFAIGLCVALTYGNLMIALLILLQ